jgi:DNA-directed RNA polymerase subunit RPC12/RpoP
MGIATDTLMVIRCPYCVFGEEFRPMVAHLDGRFICAKCGHLASPSDKDFKCRCPECSGLKPARIG